MEEQLTEQETKPENIFRVKNRAKKETRLVRDLTKDENQAREAITKVVELCPQKIKYLQSKQQLIIVHCFKCQAHGHIAANSGKAHRCPQCGGCHHIKD